MTLLSSRAVKFFSLLTLTVCLLASPWASGTEKEKQVLNHFKLKQWVAPKGLNEKFHTGLTQFFYTDACVKPINKLQEDRWRIAKFKLSAAGQKWFYLDFHHGHSDDPTYVLTSVSDPEKSFEILAETLHLPGNGNLYYERNVNAHIPLEKGKIVYAKEGFKEVPQPFYAINLETKTLNPIKLYSDEKFSQVIASLEKGSKVTALVAKPESPHILIKTPFGLTGWVKDAVFNRDLEGIYFRGD